MTGEFLRSFAESMDELADNIEAVAAGMALEVAAAAVPLIQEQWPELTGYSKSEWKADPFFGGALLHCDADYASYIYAPGDLQRTPIYPGIVAKSITRAAADLDIRGQFQDLTAAYTGQGRTTAHLTGVARKFLRHAPPDERAAWRQVCPELISVITVNGRDEEVVPSDVVAARQMGGGVF